MASIERTKSGKWSCRIYVGMKNGKNIYKRITANTKKEAEHMAHLYLEKHPVKKSGSEKTVKEAIEAYIASKSELLSPSTVAGYKRILENRFRSIQNYSIYMITQEELQTAVNEEAKTLSQKTVANAVGLLTATFKMFKVPIDKLTTGQEKADEVIIPTDDELKLLCNAADLIGIGLHVRLAAYMGLRRSEISALDLTKDVNKNNNTLRINKAIVCNSENEYVEKETKTKSSTRILPIPSVVMPSIVLAMENDDYKLTPGAIEGRFIKMKRSLGLDHITFHSLRHYFASTLVVMDVPNLYAKKLMGHSTENMLNRVYQHIRKEYLEEVTQKMDSFFSEKNKNMTTT